jgi:hypothetical protein
LKLHALTVIANATISAITTMRDARKVNLYRTGLAEQRIGDAG